MALVDPARASGEWPAVINPQARGSPDTALAGLVTGSSRFAADCDDGDCGPIPPDDVVPRPVPLEFEEGPPAALNAEIVLPALKLDDDPVPEPLDAEFVPLRSVGDVVPLPLA